jgi:hypothetical protein
MIKIIATRQGMLLVPIQHRCALTDPHRRMGVILGALIRPSRCCRAGVANSVRSLVEE